jgi:DNA polymerase-1
MQQKKIFLLDAFALIFRAYYAFINNPRISSKGLNTSAIFGFANSLLDVIKKQNPTHIAVVFDSKEDTVRHEAYEQYKANREEAPEDLTAAIPYIFQLLDALNIKYYILSGYEADDIIGTIAHKAEAAGFDVYMMTPDKDYAQLVTEKVKMYKPARLGNDVEILGVEEVIKKFDVAHPKQVIDLLGLMGDKVDNIPGIPGIGEKTAVALIKQFGSIENLIQNTDLLKGKQKENVIAYAEQGLLSKRLATIITDVPIDFVEEETLRRELNKDATRELLAELEFKRLAAQLLGEVLPAEPGSAPDLFSNPAEEQTVVAETKVFENISTTEHDYHLITSKEQCLELYQKLSAQKVICFDTETTSLDAFEAELVGISFSWKSHEAYYVATLGSKEETQEIIEIFRPLFESEDIMKVGQNIKYDLAILKNYGITLKGSLFDTMLAHYLINPDGKHGMDELAENYLNYAPVSITELIGPKGKSQKSMRDVAIEKVAEYAAEDADITYQLYEKFNEMLGDDSKQKSVLMEVETPLIPVLAAMENEGIRLDIDVLRITSSQLDGDIKIIEKEILDLAGIPFNIASPKQLGDVLFDHLKIDEKAKKTKTGQYATGEEVLAKLVNKHPIISKILDYRELVKLKNTYVDTLPELINKKTNRIHTTYNQAVAATGRLSSNNPNLQNIPIRTERGREIRKAFISRGDEYVLLSADYSQIELRIIAALSKDENMIAAFHSGVDIHTATAARVYNVSIEEVTSDMRRNSKQVNFGIIYGISAFGLSERINISRTEAKEIIDTYFATYPGIKNYMNESINNARERGYVETIIGRRRYLRDINSANAIVRGFAERNAINAPIQGSAADMIKLAMIKVYEAFNKAQLESKMLLQVHDELVFDVYKPELEQVKAIVKECMQGALTLSVPLEVEMGVANNWLEAH